MKLSRVSVGQALRSSRDVAGFTLSDLANVTSMNVSAISRSERGERDLSYAEVVEVCAALKIDVMHFQALAETFERLGATEKKQQLSLMERDLVKLQQAAINLVLEARHGT